MVLKTFNLNEDVYKEFSEYCKENGISMSKRIENFIREEVSKIRSGSSILEKDNSEKSFMSRYC